MYDKGIFSNLNSFHPSIKTNAGLNVNSLSTSRIFPFTVPLKNGIDSAIAKELSVWFFSYIKLSRFTSEKLRNIRYWWEQIPEIVVLVPPLQTDVLLLGILSSEGDL